MAAFLRNRRLLQHLLPLAAFLSAFTIVMMVLLFSFDMRGIRYRQRFNMSAAFDMLNAVQDNPQLVTHIREDYMEQNLSPGINNIRNLTATPLSQVVTKLLSNKQNGFFVETNVSPALSDTVWLEAVLHWRGLLVQPDPTNFDLLRSTARPSSTLVQACLSPTIYPKEAIFRQAPGVEPVFTTIHCFPLFSLLLAANATSADLLIMHGAGAEIQVLRTIPFSQINIPLISIEVTPESEDAVNDIMVHNKFKLVQTVDHNLIFQLIS